MNLSILREKTLAFLVPILVVGIVLGGSIALLGQTYFWDVSRLTIQIPGEKETQVKLEIQARIVYFDADLFGFYYPFHIVFPWIRTQKCTSQCVFDRIPPWDAELTIFGENGPQRLNILITPDTDGSLDLRPPFQIAPVVDTKIWDSFRAPTLSPEEQKALSNIVYSDPFWGLFVTYQNTQYALYDTTNKQSIALPFSTVPIHIARGESAGEYFFWSKDQVTRWDRYGRFPTETITQLVFRGYTLVWSHDSTTINRLDGQQSLTDIWWPIYSAKETLITDGRKFMQLQ